jgi:regulator of protease activity HflC (stomatin/prohibitin superfamily)
VWTKSHPTDVMYLVPGSSVAGTGVGYQLLMSDVRVLWRIGLSDDAARNSAYQVADPTMLIRTEALRQLQAVFATTSYPALIGADRALLTQRLQQALQTELDRHRSGVEITEVVIDAIHPPQEAVPSYHGVQAAEIGAATEVSKARSEAARTHADAQRETAERLAKATATAAEATATARTDATRFRADLDAFAMAPEAMRLERWLARTGSALGKAQVTIIDHRLDVDGGTTIDLRRPPAATE